MLILWYYVRDNGTTDITMDITKIKLVYSYTILEFVPKCA